MGSVAAAWRWRAMAPGPFRRPENCYEGWGRYGSFLPDPRDW